jgi:hypothetical protein
MKRLSALLVMALAVFVAPVTAQNNELEAAKKRIHSLTNQAEKLMVEGRHEQARKLLSDASALTKRLAAASNGNREGRGKNERDRRRDEYNGLWNHLERAVGALKESGQSAQAQKLNMYSQELRKILARGDRGRDERRDGRVRQKRQPKKTKKTKNTKKKLTERQVAAQQLEIMNYSVGVLKKAERGDAAESLHRASQALSLRLQGVRNKKAQKVYEDAPSRMATAKHLLMAGEILSGQKGKHAELVIKLGKQFYLTAERVKKNEGRERGERREREGERREVRRERDVRRDRDVRPDRERERNERGRRTDSEQRVIELRKQLAELEKALRELQKAKEQIRRRKKDK